MAQNGKLGEQLGLQLLKEQTGLEFKALQNGSNHGCDGCAIAIKDNTIWVADVKSSQNGLSNTKSPKGDPEAKLQKWLNLNWDNNVENKVFAEQIKHVLSNNPNIQVKGVAVKVGLPSPRGTGVAEFKVQPWNK
jgi:filamentous hemagglutinin